MNKKSNKGVSESMPENVKAQSRSSKSETSSAKSSRCSKCSKK